MLMKKQEEKKKMMNVEKVRKSNPNTQKREREEIGEE
jgi:hypothetical protein